MESIRNIKNFFHFNIVLNNLLEDFKKEFKENNNNNSLLLLLGFEGNFGEK